MVVKRKNTINKKIKNSKNSEIKALEKKIDKLYLRLDKHINKIDNIYIRLESNFSGIEKLLSFFRLNKR
ncbi:MAG: hypothetical protein CMI90_04165 [Pelagibacteraceae bacterium]|jgi:hypothetical protein|nr:hypothetical protein [Pelagibacteraceae bacterium]